MMYTKDQIIRLNYSDCEDKLDLYLHQRRYQVAKENIKGDLILDIGCGMGFGTRILASEMPDNKFIGIDIDENSIKYANQYNKLPNMEFKLMNATRLDFPDGYFSSIVSIENIEHVEDYEVYLKEVYRVLKPGGKLFLATPRVNRIGNLILRIKGCKIPPNPHHKHEFKTDELKDLLEKHDFKVFKIKGFYLHILPTRFGFVRKFINKKSVAKILVNASFKPLNDYFYVVAQKKKKSVLFVQESFFPPEIGRRDILEYSTHFKRLGWDCTCLVYTGKNNHEEKEYDGIKIIGVCRKLRNKYASSFLFSLKCVGYIFKNRKEYSIIHAINTFRFSLLFIAVARIYRIRVIYDIRTAPIREKDIFYIAYQVIEFLNCLFSNRVIIIDKRLIKELRISFLSSRISESSPGVNLTDIKTLKAKVRGDFGIPERSKIYIYSGTLDMERNPLFFVRAFYEFSEGKEDNVLLVLGDGNQSGKIKEFINKNGIKNIFLLGKVMNQEVFPILKLCDYGISYIPKKKYYEYQPPLKTLEYLACGLAVIATDTSGNRVFVNKESGVLVEDNMPSIIRGFREIQRIKPKIDVSRFDWLNLCKKIEGIYLNY